MSYKMDFDNEPKPGDQEFEDRGEKLVTEPVKLSSISTASAVSLNLTPKVPPKTNGLSFRLSEKRTQANALVLYQ